MKPKFLLNKTFYLGLFILFLVPAAGCASNMDSSNQENMSPKTVPYEVPKEKMQRWESLKNKALKDYDICQEHCGYEQDCLDRCEEAYKARLDNDYKNLMEQ